jgi:glycosyltransferase involved in cell wall biosynthesis
MHYPLAIATFLYGEPSETFILQHARDILPGGTVLLALKKSSPFGWSPAPDCPVEVLQDNRSGLLEAALRKVLQQPNPGLRRNEENARRFFQTYGVEVMLCEYLHAALMWLDFAQRHGIRLYAHAHGHDLSRRYRDPGFREQCKRFHNADGIITVNRVQRDRLLDMGLPAEIIHSVPYGVEVPDQPVYRKVGNRVKCLAAGRMVGKKAPLLLLESFREVIRAKDNVDLEVIGDGTLLPAAKQFAREHGLESRVKFTGMQPHAAVLKAIRNADIFVRHSIVCPETGDEEGLPVAILEAMAHSLPVVSTYHAGIPEAVIDGMTGWLVREGNTSGMAERIIHLAGDSSARQSMGKAGWERAREKYTKERQIADLRRILGVSH